MLDVVKMTLQNPVLSTNNSQKEGCEELHNPQTQLYTFSDSYIAEEVIDEMRGK
jgi:hypothetical protein